MNLNSCFDNIYVLYINSTEKYRIEQKLMKHAIVAEYFLGVDGKNEKDKYANYLAYYKTLDQTIYKELTVGQFGHTCSFIEILKDGIKKGYKKILILEADVYFADNFKNLKKYTELDYKLLYLGCSQNKYYAEDTWITVQKNNKDIIKNGYYKAYKTLGTFALAIDKSMFEPYLRLLQKFMYTSD